MELEKLEEERDYWTMLLFDIPDEQAASCHLFFSLLVQNQLKGIKKDKQNPFLLIYLERAALYIKDSLKKEVPSQASFDQTIASFAWHEMFDNVMQSNSPIQLEQKRLYLQGVKMIMENFKDIVGEKSFREYFDDVTFDKRDRVNSKKAQALILEYIEKARNDDEYSLESEDVYDDEESEWPPVYYENNWNNVDTLLAEMPQENALVFHAISLQLCRKCELEPRSYSKYQKAVVKAISTFKGTSNQRQIEFVLSNTDDAFVKFKEKLLLEIEVGYESGEVNQNPEITQMETYTLASDLCLSNVNAFDSVTVDDILNSIKLDKENFFSCDEIEKCCNLYNELAEDQLEELITGSYDYEEDDEDYTDEDVDYVEDQDHESSEAEQDSDSAKKLALQESKEDLKKHIASMLDSLDLSHDLFLHVVYRNILDSSEILFEISKPYIKAVSSNIKIYKDTDDSIQKEMARKNTDKVFLEVVYHIMDVLDEQRGNSEVEIADNINHLLVLNALVYSLEDIPSIDTKSIEKSLENLDYDNQFGDYFDVATDAFALKYKTNASTECMYNLVNTFQKNLSDSFFSEE